ncbi:MAG: hypothetical protein ABI844_18535 [Saprospiraceae bacterium]
MGLIKFKQIKPIPFDFRPRYWDPEKERKEARLKEIKAMQDESIEGVKARLSRRFQGRYNEYYSEKKRAMQKQNMILIAVLISVLFGAYYFLLRYMPLIEGWLDKSLKK